jgi:hypothetical protein
MDVGWGRDDNAIYQCEVHGGENQHWLLRQTPEGYCIIQSSYSGKCLDLAAFSHENGAITVAWEFWGADNQVWKLEQLEDQSFLIRARHSGLVLEIAGATLDNGRYVVQWEWHGGDNQRWWIVPAV